MAINKVKYHLCNGFLLFVVLCTLGCYSDPQTELAQEESLDQSIDLSIKDSMIQEPLMITYHIDTVSKDLDNFYFSYTAPQQEVILAINRISESSLRRGSVLLIPDTFLLDLLPYAPFPDSISSAVPINKLIMISQRIQAFGAYENGSLTRWGPVSTGKRSTPTPNGLYHTNFKARIKISTINRSWIMPWYYNIANRDGIGMHQYLLPGFPASHACIRLFEKDAVWIYNWAEGWILDATGQNVLQNGTPVILFGAYDYKIVAPWRLLSRNSNSTELSNGELIEMHELLGKVKL